MLSSAPTASRRRETRHDLGTDHHALQPRLLPTVRGALPNKGSVRGQGQAGWLGRDNTQLLRANRKRRRTVSRPDSPCIAICDTLYQDVCTGCGRHYLEVAQWTTMSQQEKDKVWDRIEAEGTAKRFTTYRERAQQQTNEGDHETETQTTRASKAEQQPRCEP